ncbi:hypothetical protein DFP73DRAFT_539752 [Morchella snyderi]|nr:hypothetical protein DFP73DRAFT_539752 [Morchella snyderi]
MSAQRMWGCMGLVFAVFLRPSGGGRREARRRIAGRKFSGAGLDSVYIGDKVGKNLEMHLICWVLSSNGLIRKSFQ